MSLCPNGEKSIIEWQYPDEDKQKIIGASDYSTELVVGNVHSYLWWWEIEVKWRYIFATAGASNQFLLRTYNTNNMRFGSSTVGVVNGYPLLSQLSEYNQNANNDRLQIPYETKNAQGNISITQYNLYLSSSYRPHSWTVNFLCVTPTAQGGCATPQPSGSCVFKIFSGNQEIVYQRSNPVCPVVTYSCGEKCPPGTCECSCGNVVCCHDSRTGEVVKSFRK